MTNRHPSDRSDGVAYRTTEAARRTATATQAAPGTATAAKTAGETASGVTLR